jgi:glucose/arabinose dehydrogenase
VARRSAALALLAVLVLVAVTPAAAVVVTQPSLKTSVVQSGLVNPWDVAFAPGGQMFVTERPGRVRVYRNGAWHAGLLATTTLHGVRAEGEAGVMGIALHPNFGKYRFAYVCVSRQFGGQWLNQLIKYQVDSSWHLIHKKNLVESGARANTNHNGCAVEIGPDRKIWMSMGDAGNGDRAQDPSSLNGKILRLNLNGTVPKGNPIMPGASERTIVYSMGHRNPQGIAFRPGNGKVFAVEHGPTVNDEINWIRPGLNYGWPCVTGYGTPFQACAPGGDFTDPAWASGGSTIANSGGAFVDGAAWGTYDNQLLTAQLKESDLRRYRIKDGGATALRKAIYFNNRWGRLRAVTLGPNSRVWITTSNGSNDKIIRITPVL